MLTLTLTKAIIMDTHDLDIFLEDLSAKTEDVSGTFKNAVIANKIN